MAMNHFAMIDMQSQLVPAGLFLLLGILAIISLRPKGSRGWALTAVAFFVAPTIALIWWAIVAFMSGDYITNEERFEDLWPFLAIGGIVGTAIALSVAAINLVVALSVAASNLVRNPNREIIATHGHPGDHQEEIIHGKE
jgi:hypothetical protein